MDGEGWMDDESASVVTDGGNLAMGTCGIGLE